MLKTNYRSVLAYKHTHVETEELQPQKHTLMQLWTTASQEFHKANHAVPRSSTVKEEWSGDAYGPFTEMPEVIAMFHIRPAE